MSSFYISFIRFTHATQGRPLNKSPLYLRCIHQSESDPPRRQHWKYCKTNSSFSCLSFFPPPLSTLKLVTVLRSRPQPPPSLPPLPPPLPSTTTPPPLSLPSTTTPLLFHHHTTTPLHLLPLHLLGQTNGNKILERSPPVPNVQKNQVYRINDATLCEHWMLRFGTAWLLSRILSEVNVIFSVFQCTAFDIAFSVEWALKYWTFGTLTFVSC